MKYRKGHLYRAKHHLSEPAWTDDYPDTDYGQSGSYHLCLGVVCPVDAIGANLVSFYSLEKQKVFSMILRLDDDRHFENA